MLKISALTLALTALAPHAEAGALPGPVKNLVQAQLKSVATSQPRRRLEAATSCSDFSGNWAGTCRIKDQDVKVSFSLSQDGCKSITIDGDKIDMGHDAIEGDSSIYASATVQAATRFSPDGQKAQAFATLFIDSPYLVDTVSGRLGGELQKAGDGLQLDGQIDLWVGMKDQASLPVTCTVTKSK